MNETVRDILEAVPSLCAFCVGATVGWAPRLRTVTTWMLCAALAAAMLGLAAVAVIQGASAIVLITLPGWSAFAAFGMRTTDTQVRPRPTPTGAVGPASRAFKRNS